MFLLYDTLASTLLSDAEEGGYKIYLIYFIAKHQCLPGIGAFQFFALQPAYTTMLLLQTQRFPGAVSTTNTLTLQVGCKHGLSLGTQPLSRIL